MNRGGVARGILLWETGWWAAGKIDRLRQFAAASAAARRAGGPMLVVGLPDGQYPWPQAGSTVVDLRPRPAGVPSGVRYVQASVERLPFADSEFASCFCSHVIEHAADPARALRELRRVSRTSPRICYPRPWRIATWLVPGHRWLVTGEGDRLRFAPNPISDGRVNVPTRYGTARPTVFGAASSDGVALDRRRIAAALAIGIGGSALANVVTHRIAARRGYWPAVAGAAAIAGAGVYLMATS